MKSGLNSLVKKLNYMVSAIVTFSNERQAHLRAQMNRVQAAQTIHKNTNRLMFTEMENTSEMKSVYDKHICIVP